MANEQVAVTLNTQTVNTLIQQVDVMLNQPSVGDNQKLAFENFRKALQGVLPYVPKPVHEQTDELTLDSDIRKEIEIAGANENG